MDDTITVTCTCGKQFLVKSEHAGKRTRCKVCGTVITIPRQSGPQFAAVAAEPSTGQLTPVESAATAEAEVAAEATAPVEAAEAVVEAPIVTDDPANAAADPITPKPRPMPRASKPRPPSNVNQAGGFEPIDPNALLTGLGATSFPRTLVIAIVLLSALIGVTSIGFIGLCVKYKTMFPMVKVAEEAKAAQEVKDKEEREKTLKKYQPVAAPKTEAPSEAAKPAATPAPAPGTGDSKIERTVRETSTEKPKEMTLDLGNPQGLE